MIFSQTTVLLVTEAYMYGFLVAGETTWILQLYSCMSNNLFLLNVFFKFILFSLDDFLMGGISAQVSLLMILLRYMYIL